MDYAESRLYAPGDDVRHIDWRVTARTGKAHTKLYEAERDRITALVIDSSPAMDFGTRVCFKRVQASRIAALLAWYAEADGDRLCAAVCGSRSGQVPPAGGRRGVLRVLSALAQWSNPADGAASISLAATLDRLGRILRPGSHILLALDHRSLDEEARRAMSRLRAHHDLACALIVDPIEWEAPPPARYPITYGAVRSLLALESRSQRAAWSDHFRQALADAHERLRRAGVRARTVRTDDDPVDALRLLLRGVSERSAA